MKLRLLKPRPLKPRLPKPLLLRLPLSLLVNVDCEGRTHSFCLFDGALPLSGGVLLEEDRNSVVISLVEYVRGCDDAISGADADVLVQFDSQQILLG